MAGAYIVTVSDAYNAIGDRNKARAAAVYADNSTDVKELLEALFGGDLDALWANSTVTVMAAASDMLGWKLQVIVTHPVSGVEVANVTVLGADSDDTIDEIAALMVTALNATDVIDGAEYNSTSQTLTISDASDALGDHNVAVFVFSPLSDKVAIPGFVGAITDAGSDSDTLEVVFSADAYTVPAVMGAFKGAL